jgi:hypothetical protein
VTTAAAALEEPRTALSAEAVFVEARLAPQSVPAIAVPHIATRPTASHAILAAILLIQAGWLVVLGYFAYKLI